jgi:hypothetical protein
MRVQLEARPLNARASASPSTALQTVPSAQPTFIGLRLTKGRGEPQPAAPHRTAGQRRHLRDDLVLDGEIC